MSMEALRPTRLTTLMFQGRGLVVSYAFRQLHPRIVGIGRHRAILRLSLHKWLRLREVLPLWQLSPGLLRKAC
jgi:hypothetical protein